MNTQNIRLMFEYNYWANGKILADAAKLTPEQFLAPADFPHGGLRGTLVHLVDGERIWRVLFETHKVTEDEDLVAGDFPTFESVEKKFQEEEKLMRAYLGRLTEEDLNGHLIYTTSQGIQRDRILWHCLYHLANHGTHHRSEAAAILTSFNASPGDIDFTLFLNEFKP